MTTWDIIGDIHGHAEDLISLLRSLGYRRRGGSWRQRGFRLLFLGDYVNRGPEIPAAVDLVRAIVEEGDGVALLGNHDFNLIQVVMGELTGKESRQALHRVKQAEDSLAAYRGNRQKLDRALTWLKSLPLIWDHEGFRAVHACWHQSSVRILLETAGPILRDEDFILGAEGSRVRAVELLLNGPELTLPDGDSVGRRNARVRTKWWLAGAATWKAAAYPEEPDLPERELPPDAAQAFFNYGPEEPPVFFGHYGFRKPMQPVLPNAACLDFAIARDGFLGGYRWAGERVLRRSRFFRTPVRIEGR